MAEYRLTFENEKDFFFAKDIPSVGDQGNVTIYPPEDAPVRFQVNRLDGNHYSITQTVLNKSPSVLVPHILGEKQALQAAYGQARAYADRQGGSCEDKTGFTNLSPEQPTTNHFISQTLENKTFTDPKNPSRNLTFEGFTDITAGEKAYIKLRDSKQPEKHQITNYPLSYFLGLEIHQKETLDESS